MRKEILIFLLFFIACSSIPHYKEKFVSSSSITLTNETINDIWAASLDTLIEMDYVISNTDKLGGMIYAEKEQAHPAIASVREANTLTILIRKQNSDIIIKCQSRVLSSIVNPDKEIKKFFILLKKNLGIKERNQ